MTHCTGHRAVCVVAAHVAAPSTRTTVVSQACCRWLAMRCALVRTSRWSSCSAQLTPLSFTNTVWKSRRLLQAQGDDAGASEQVIRSAFSPPSRASPAALACHRPWPPAPQQHRRPQMHTTHFWYLCAISSRSNARCIACLYVGSGAASTKRTSS